VAYTVISSNIACGRGHPAVYLPLATVKKSKPQKAKF
jgi:hypothetical protein